MRVVAMLLACYGLLPLSALGAEAPYFRPLDFAWQDGRWRATAYAGVVATGGVTEIFFRGDPQLERAGLVGLALGREIGATLNGALRMEWEAGAALSFEPGQTLGDLRLMVGGRWTDFPWNRYLPTSFAFLIGPSWLSGRSVYENEEGEARRWAAGYAMEITVAPPGWERAMLVGRLHHRSFIFGLLGDGTPSDWVTLGLHWRF